MIIHRGAPGYRAYLLRCWQEHSASLDGAAVWRFSLEDTRVAARAGFATLEALVAAVQRDLEQMERCGLTLQATTSTEEHSMTHDREADELAIRTAINAVEAGWNAGDGNGFAAPFADDADYVVVNGSYVKGRQEIARGHQHIFDTIYRDSHNVASVQHVRFLGGDVAVAHCEWHLTFQRDGASQRNRAISTLVMTRANGAWSIAAFQNTPLAPPQT